MKKILPAVFCCALLTGRLNAQPGGYPQLGFGLSPAGFPVTYANIFNFFSEVADSVCSGGIAYGNGAWRDAPASSGNIPGFAKLVSLNQPSPYGYTDMLTFAWASYPLLYLSTPNNPVNNWTNNNTRVLFLQALVRAADSLRPAYLFIGNEVDFYIGQDSAGYSNWCSFYRMAYDSVKAHSPSTKVGTVFSYEHLSGMGTLTGWTAPHWNALTDMDTSRMDVIGISLYPFFGNTNASLVPSTYLDALFNRAGNIPVVITETGWPADPFIGSWTSSPTEQVNYVNKIFNLISTRNVPAMNWLFLNYLMDHSNTGDSIFCSVSLRDSSGNDRPAKSLWLSHCNYTGIAANPSHEENILVYPNPSNGEVNFSVNGSGKIKGLKIYNSTGQLVFSYNGPDAGQTLRLDLPEGLYFYRTDTTAGKFIIKGKN